MGRIFRRGEPPQPRAPVLDAGDPRPYLPKGLRKFYDVYDTKFDVQLSERFNAWAGERGKVGDERWAALTQQFATARDSFAATIAAFSREMEAGLGKVALIEERVGRAEEAAQKAAETATAHAAPAQDPALIERLKEVEDRLALMDLEGGGEEETPPARPAARGPPPREPDRRRRAAPEPREESEQNCCGGEYRDCCHEAEPPPRQRKRDEKPRPDFVEEEKPETPRPARAPSPLPTADEMLDQIPEGKRLNLPRFLWALAEEDGGVNRNKLADVFKHRGVRLGIQDIETAAKALKMGERRNRKQEPVYFIGPDSTPPQ